MIEFADHNRYRELCCNGPTSTLQRMTVQLTSLARFSRRSYYMDDLEKRTPNVEVEKDLESLFLSLVENLPVHVARKDLSGHITFANQAFCRLLGMSRSEVIGKTDYDFFPKELAEKYRHDDMLVERTGQTFSDIEANYSGGETHYFEVRKTPVCSSTGKVVGTQVIFWDVSATSGPRQNWTRAPIT